jgi:hypothetical protein
MNMRYGFTMEYDANSDPVIGEIDRTTLPLMGVNAETVDEWIESHGRYVHHSRLRCGEGVIYTFTAPE